MSTRGNARAIDAPTQHAIRAELLRRLGRQWRVGDRLPPIKELARQLGTGQSNTQRAVQLLARQGLLVSRQRQGTFVARLPNGRSQPTDDRGARFDLSSRTIRIYHAGIEPEGFIGRMIAVFLEVIDSTGARVEHGIYASMTKPTELDPDADAVVLFNPQTPLLPPRPQQHTVVVTTAMRMVAPRAGAYDLVGIDDYQGGLLAGETMAASGCRNVCFLGRIHPAALHRYETTSMIRLYGFEAGWGKPVEPQRLLYAWGYNPMAVGEMFHEYLALKPRPDGVFVASDDMAIGFVAAAAAHGLRAGRDYQVIGFDGQERGRQIALTSVRVPAEEMGRRAATLLMERFAQPERPNHRIQLDCTMQFGNTLRIASRT